MKRIVVTGATSMIGMALIQECIENHVEVLAIIRKNSVHLGRLPKSELLHICEWNLDELNAFPEPSEAYDVFYHLAWDYTSKEYRDSPLFQEKNIKYTLEAVKLAVQMGCQKFIGAGSQAEYGKLVQAISPDTPVNPDTAYGIAKYAAGRLSEKLCSQYSICHIWGRIFSVYGRYDNENTMLSYGINQFLKGEPARFSKATQMWDYLHERDAGKMFFQMGQYGEKSGVYCIASGEARPLKEFILQMKECFGQEAVCEFANKPHSEEVYGIQADISTFVKEIGYRPQVSFQEGIQDMIQYKRQVLGGE